MDQVDCAVVGAGVVGLAVAAALARNGRDVVVLECASTIGSQTSSRNSEVIHAGLYYRPDSLKARLCVSGARQLYDYCVSRNISYWRCGKLIVATADDELASLQNIAANAEACGVDTLSRWSRAQVAAAEPALRCLEALHSPMTGIVDSHGLMLALQGELEDFGGAIAFQTPVLGGERGKIGAVLNIAGSEPCSIACRWLINAAGLEAPAVAASLDGFPAAAVPRRYLAKGSYFALTGPSPATRLVYPAPAAGGLGIHLTLDLSKQVRFGPDVEWVDEVDYRIETGRVDMFEKAIRRYWPGLPADALSPAYSGIRPKLSGPGEPAADFLIQSEPDHGCPGIINLFGIESPGLTASLALGDHVAAMVVAGG